MPLGTWMGSHLVFTRLMFSCSYLVQRYPSLCVFTSPPWKTLGSSCDMLGSAGSSRAEGVLLIDGGKMPIGWPK